MAEDPFEPDPVEESQPSLSIVNAIAARDYHGQKQITDESTIAIKIYDEQNLNQANNSANHVDIAIADSAS